MTALSIWNGLELDKKRNWSSAGLRLVLWKCQ